MAARQRSPFGAQPRRRAIFVERPLSSIKIRCSGSRSCWLSIQFSRAAFTSERSCSLAWAVFFMRQAVPVEKLPHRGPHHRDTAFLPQPLDHLVKRRVRRLCESAQNEIRMRIQHSPLRLALFGGTNVPGGPLQPRPCSGRRDPDRKPSRRLMRRFPSFNRRNNPLSQIHAVWLAHPILPTQSQRWNQHSASKRIPPTRFLRNLL